MTTLPVSEVFGPVWQGEGPHTGRLCSFVRLGLCNLACSWCDTPYTWDHTRFDVNAECPPRTPEDIAATLRAHGTEVVVLSGGEPLVHQTTDALQELLTARLPNIEWHVETNGTLEPRGWLIGAVSHFTVSPKLDQGDPAKRRLRPTALESFGRLARAGKAAWKVVCRHPADVDEAVEMFDAYRVPPSARWVMPEGVTSAAVLTGALGISEAATKHRLNLTLRNHTLMYEQERAR